MLEQNTTAAQPATPGEPEYPFDVFVSYSRVDQVFVKEWLVPRLEGEGLAVCIDYRDFDIGQTIVRNIGLAVQKSALEC